MPEQDDEIAAAMQVVVRRPGRRKLIYDRDRRMVVSITAPFLMRTTWSKDGERVELFRPSLEDTWFDA